MKKASFRTITNFTICAVIIAALSLTHLAWGQGEQAEAEQVQREAPRDAGGPEKGAVARILAGVEEGKISKEKAAEMVKALNKNIDQEDPTLKMLLEQYWKADPSVRGLLSTRIEGYLQHMAAGHGRNNERGFQRGGERPLSPAVARLHREVGNYDFTARINMDAVGQDGGVINLQGTADVQMILDGQFLLNRGLQAGNESVTIMGVTGSNDAEYFRISLDGSQTGFIYAQGGLQEDGSRVMKYPGGGPGHEFTFRTTFEDNGGFTTSLLVGPQQAEFMTTTHTRARRQPIDVLETMLSSPVKPTRVNRSANSPDPGANFSPEHLVLQEFAGDFEVDGKEGKVRSRMICQGRFLVSERSVEDNNTVTFTGFDSARRAFQHIILDPEMPGFRYFEGTRQEDGAIVFAARDGRDGLSSTVMLHDDGGYTLADGDQSMRFRAVVEERGRGEARMHDEDAPGTLKWSIPLGGIVGYCSPAIAEDGTIYIGGGANTLHALNPDGTKKWSFAASGAVVSTPAIGKDGTIYIGCYDDHLYAMNPDGTKKWSFRAEFNIFSSPAVGQDGTIYIGSENGKLYAVNPEDGSQKWDFQTGYFIHGSPSIAKDGTVYIGSSDKNLYAINPKDGSEKWRFTAKDQVHAPPAIGMDGTLYVGSNDGNFGSGGHRGPGEEVIPIAICNNLRETDCFHPNFRTAFCLFTKPGFALEDTVAQYLGRRPRHNPWFTPQYGTMGSSGTLGEPAVKYLGATVANVIKKTDDVTVFVQGDGAANRAPTHEAMVVAAAWRLPMVFVIQNNRYGMGTAVEKSYNISDLSLRGAGYGMPHERVDGNDMIATYLVMRKYIEMARSGGGPSVVAADTYRLRPHYEGDAQIYRPEGEMDEWVRTKDPLPRYQKRLIELGVLEQADIDRLEEEVAAEIEAAVEAVKDLPPSRTYEEFEKTAIAEL